MKILHTVERYKPSVGGMQEHVRQISERLVQKGHQVTVATSTATERKEKMINGVKIVEFSLYGNMVKGFTGNDEQYRCFLLESDFDIVTNFAAQQWATDLSLPLLKKIKGKKVFVPTGFSGLFIPEYNDYFESMKTWLHHYDMNIFLSEDYRDINFARSCGVTKMRVIPNGAGADEFLHNHGNGVRRKLGIDEDQFLILHVGSHTGMKGHDAALAIFARARIKEAVFLLVGNVFSYHCKRDCSLKAVLFNSIPTRLLDRKKIIIADLSREMTVAAYKTADLFLFPSMVECSPLVLFECMASNTPFLATDVGNASEIVKWSTGAGVVLPTEKDAHGFSRAIVSPSARLLGELYHSPGRREAMASAGYQAWQERFTWEAIAGEYENVYMKLLSV